MDFGYLGEAFGYSQQALNLPALLLKVFPVLFPVFPILFAALPVVLAVSTHEFEVHGEGGDAVIYIHLRFPIPILSL